MHEYYVMQILEKQEQNQRTMVTKGRAMKHKDQEDKNKSGTQNHTNHLTKRLKLASIKRFGKYVGILTLSRNILKTHNFSFNKIPNEVIPNLYVLSLRMLNRVFRYVNNTRVITVNHHGKKRVHGKKTLTICISEPL